MITREDLMRELELLPVWQLRQTVSQVVEPNSSQPKLDIHPHEQIKLSETQQKTIAEAGLSEDALSNFRVIVSEGGDWLFLLNANQSMEEEVLLQNMLKAVSVKPKRDTKQAAREDLSQHQSKIIVVMGEQEAQDLLTLKDDIEALRGKVHNFQNRLLIVTYSPQHLLLNLADKSKAWEDLCFAKFTISSLVSE